MEKGEGRRVVSPFSLLPSPFSLLPSPKATSYSEATYQRPLKPVVTRSDVLRLIDVVQTARAEAGLAGDSMVRRGMCTFLA